MKVNNNKPLIRKGYQSFHLHLPHLPHFLNHKFGGCYHEWTEKNKPKQMIRNVKSDVHRDLRREFHRVTEGE